MSSLLDEDRLLIRDAVVKFIADNYPLETVAERDYSAAKFGRNWSVFADLGWLCLLPGESAGGMGGGVIDAQVLLREFGKGLIVEPFTEVALTAAKTLEHCLPAERQEALLAPLIAGSSRAVLAHGEELADPGFANIECQARQTATGYTLTGTKRMVWQAGAADWYLVTALLNGQPAIFKVGSAADKLVINEFPTIDSRYAADLQLLELSVAASDLLATGERAAHAVRQAILLTYAALIGEVSGICDQLIALTSSYLNTREQFGGKLAGFQALQHRLADMVIAAEEIRSLQWLVAGASEMDDETEAEKLVRSARARVGKLSRALGETAVQLHGGVGVSNELIVSHYLRRLIAIDAFYGDANEQLIWLAEQY
jgi:alkylation response protein AidB-like acyl-CoA dehydrogenase